MTSAKPVVAIPAQGDNHGRHQATLADVLNCYRFFLGREPESASAATAQLVDTPELWALIGRFLASPEAALQTIYSASRSINSRQDSSAINIAMTDAQKAELNDHIKTVWQRYGRDDAYFSVLTHPRYRADRIVASDIEEFYRTGVAEADDFDAVCRRNGIMIDRRTSVLELGCGVGRVGASFAQRFGGYLGVDISADHLALARDRFEAQGLSSAQLQLLGQFIADVSTYDLFYSVMVLQHNPPPIMLDLLDVCLGRLKPRGYAYFQVPCHLESYSFDAAAYIAGAGRREIMEMHAVPQHHIFAVLAAHGMTPIEVLPDGHIGPIGMSYTFLARKAG